MVWVLFHIQFSMSASLEQIFSRAVFLAAVTTKSPSKRIRHMKKQAQVIKPSWLGMDHFFFFFSSSQTGVSMTAWSDLIVQGLVTCHCY